MNNTTSTTFSKFSSSKTPTESLERRISLSNWSNDQSISSTRNWTTDWYSSTKLTTTSEAIISTSHWSSTKSSTSTRRLRVGPTETTENGGSIVENILIYVGCGVVAIFIILSGLCFFLHQKQKKKAKISREAVKVALVEVIGTTKSVKKRDSPASSIHSSNLKSKHIRSQSRQRKK